MPAHSFGAKIISVIVGKGGLDSQGGTLVRAIVDEHSMFTARAIFERGAPADAIKTMKEELGKDNVEIAEDVDYYNESAISLAIQNSYGFFCSTFYWDLMNPDWELRQAQSMAKAAKHAEVKHVIWSTLEDTRKQLPANSTIPTLFERYKVPQHDAKAEADQMFVNLKLPTTFLLTPFCWDNFMKTDLTPKMSQDDHLTISVPIGRNTRLAGIASEDIGKCALEIFKRVDELIGKRIGIVSECLTLKEIADKMTVVFGKEVYYYHVGFDEYRKRKNLPCAFERGNVFQYYSECEEQFCSARSVEKTRELNPSLLNFENWLNKYKNHFSFS
jgi:hypothetical protein